MDDAMLAHYFLCVIYIGHDGAITPADTRRHMELADDPSVPNELRSSLKRLIFAGWPYR